MYSPLFTADDGDCISSPLFTAKERLDRKRMSNPYGLDNDDLYGAECSRMSQQGQDKIKSEKLKSLIAYFYNR